MGAVGGKSQTVEDKDSLIYQAVNEVMNATFDLLSLPVVLSHTSSISPT